MQEKGCDLLVDNGYDFAQNEFDLQECGPYINATHCEHPIDCCMCGKTISGPNYYTINNDIVCKECLDAYCIKHYDSYIDKFIDGADFASFIEFKALSRIEVKKLIKYGIRKLEFDGNPPKELQEVKELIPDMKYDYMLDNLSDFSEFVREECET